MRSYCFLAKATFKPVGTRPGILYGLCNVHKDIIDNCLPFRPILSAINTPTYKLAKFLVLIVKSLTSNEYTVKNSFAFAEEIVEQDSEFFMGNLDIDSLFTNIPFEETIDICTDDDHRQVHAHTHLQRPVALYKVITSFHQRPIKQALHHTNI